MLLEGKKVFVGPFLKRAERPADKEAHYTNIFIKNLAESVTEEQLHKLFAEHGTARARACAAANVFGLCSLHLPSHLALLQVWPCVSPVSTSGKAECLGRRTLLICSRKATAFVPTKRWWFAFGGAPGQWR